MLVVRRHDTKSLVLIRKLITSELKPTYIWCDGWPGKHVLGEDCSFVCLSKKQMPVVEFFALNPLDKISRAAKELKLTYIEVSRIVKCLDIPVTPERKERSQSAAKLCNTAFIF